MTTTEAAAVSCLQQQWILLWDRSPGQPPTEFSAVFADYYDWSSNDVILQDEFDPDHRSFVSASHYGAAFWPGFMQMRAAEHAIAEPPQVLVGGRLAASRFVFIARLTAADGTVSANRCTTSQVWRKGLDGRWRIIRDQTMVLKIPIADADQALRSLPRQPVDHLSSPR